MLWSLIRTFTGAQHRFGKAEQACSRGAGLQVSLFGYTEWLMYTKVYADLFYKYNAYIPTAAYYNELSAARRMWRQPTLVWHGHAAGSASLCPYRLRPCTVLSAWPLSVWQGFQRHEGREQMDAHTDSSELQTLGGWEVCRTPVLCSFTLRPTVLLESISY